MQAAGGHAGEAFAMLRDETHDFLLTLVRGVAKCSLAAHLSATGFERKREVKHAELLLGERGRRFVLASSDLAGCRHRSQNSIRSHPEPKSQRGVSRVPPILHGPDGHSAA